MIKGFTDLLDDWFKLRPPSSEQQILRPWIAVNFVVALLAGAAWAVISTGPDIDYTEGKPMTNDF